MSSLTKFFSSNSSLISIAIPAAILILVVVLLIRDQRTAQTQTLNSRDVMNLAETLVAHNSGDSMKETDAMMMTENTGHVMDETESMDNMQGSMGMMNEEGNMGDVHDSMGMMNMDTNFSPPEAARTYAYVATMYYEVLARGGGKEEATIAATRILRQMYPNMSDEIDSFLKEKHLNTDTSFSPSVRDTVTALLLREKDEHEQPMRHVTPPEGSNHWQGNDPIGLDALQWNQWILNKSYLSSLDVPPAEASAKQRNALSEVVSATQNRTPEQSAEINFWSGMYMSPGLAGIWQDVLFGTIGQKNLSDEQYAFAQMILAQAVLDTYIQVWDAKYTFWTKRPSTYDQNVAITMVDPRYPSYISEYATVGTVASNILTALFPKEKGVWLSNAESSSQIGVWAGCAFPYDETSGAKFGTLLSEEILSSLSISK